MANTYKSASFDDIERLREVITQVCAAAPDVETAAAELSRVLLGASSSCVLARIFMVLPLRRMTEGERTWAGIFARTIERGSALAPATPVLSLLGTAGVESPWNDRAFSVGHRAIPLIDQSFVNSAPMIAALLSSFNLDIGTTNTGEIALRTAAGGLNARFLVGDAQTSVDAGGRFVIAAREFVARHEVRSVFGMGGSYVGGELVAAILFTRETMSEADVDRYTSLISTFKMATAAHVASGRIYSAPTVLSARL